MSNEAYVRELVDRLQNRDHSKEGVESIYGCKYIASTLMQLVWETHGEAWARSIFLELGWPVDANEASARRIFQWLRKINKREQQYGADSELLFELEVMGKSAGQLAREIAERENIDRDTADMRIKRAKRRHRRMMGGDISKK